MKTMRIKQPLCALSLALLMAAPFTACSNDEANEPQPNTGKIVLTPQLGAEAWKDAAAGTRAPQAVTLKEGGELVVCIFTTKDDGSGGIEQVPGSYQQNHFKITAKGALERIPYDNGNKPSETEENLSVPRPGEYTIMASGLMNFTDNNDTPFKAFIMSTDYDGNTNMGNVVDIADDGKLKIETKVVSAGIKLELLNPDGTPYTGGEVTVSCLWENYDSASTTEEKTLDGSLGTPVITGIWGHLRAKTASATVDQDNPNGNKVFTIKETAAGGKTYELKFSGAELTLAEGNLYTFKVRVGGTELVLDGSHTIKDFETGIDSSNDADGNGSIDADLKRDTQTP